MRFLRIVPMRLGDSANEPCQPAVCHSKLIAIRKTRFSAMLFVLVRDLLKKEREYAGILIRVV